MRRVIQFSTGNVGRHALRTLIDRPDLELVGVHVNGADKVGRDAAELCGHTSPAGWWPPTTSTRWSRWAPIAWCTCRADHVPAGSLDIVVGRPGP
jgi:hypothetical protein